MIGINTRSRNNMVRINNLHFLLTLGTIVFLAGCRSQLDIDATKIMIAANESVTPWSRGESVADLSFTKFDGTTLNLEQLLGQDKAIILYFWDSQHQLSQLQLPQLSSLAATYNDQLTVIAIHRTDAETLAAGEDFVSELDLDLPLVIGTRDLYLATGGIGMPVLVFITPSGIVDQIYYGYQDDAALLETIKTLTSSNLIN